MTGGLAGARIGLLTASASRLGGGVFEAVVSHARMLRELGAEPHVFALRDAHAEEDESRFEGAPVTLAQVRGPGQIGYAPTLTPAMLDADLDCVHLHGIWMYPSAAGAAWSERASRPLIISPHGMLDPWITARGRWKKALARIGYERKAWRTAWRMHALTGREAQDILSEAGRGDSAVIPNAGPAPVTSARTMPGPCVTYIGRIHPKKNLIALIRGWAKARRPDDARLVIAGWGDDASLANVRAAAAAAGPTVEFVGPAFGEAKAALLARSRFVVLPSHSEGLPMAILEAWAGGTPTLMTAQCNLPGGFSAGAALDCGNGEEAIAVCLGGALAMDQAEWQTMANAACSLAQTQFSPSSVANQWTAVYGEALRAKAAA